MACAGDVLHIRADARAALALEHLIDQRQDRRRGAEGMQERAILERCAGRGQALPEMLPHPVEPAGIGPLEGIDRLFLVADDEDRARHVRSRAGP